MISKTFESEGPEDRLLEIHRREERIWMTIRDRGTWEKSFRIKIQDVPEILASLEEVTSLAKHTAEAEAQAKLEAEALELENAGRDAAGAGRIQELSEMGHAGREFILAVTRKAREIAREQDNDQ